jgi:hypothetical protein
MSTDPADMIRSLEHAIGPKGPVATRGRCADPPIPHTVLARSAR